MTFYRNLPNISLDNQPTVHHLPVLPPHIFDEASPFCPNEGNPPPRPCRPVSVSMEEDCDPGPCCPGEEAKR